MDEILNTFQLEYEKSSYLIELVKHDNGLEYVNIRHIIHSLGKPKISSIKINPIALPELILILKELNERFETEQTKKNINKESKTSLNLIDKADLMQKSYLKGVSIKNLAMQFDCKENIIEIILRIRGIEIVSNKIPIIKKWWRFKRRT